MTIASIINAIIYGFNRTIVGLKFLKSYAEVDDSIVLIELS